MRQVACGDANQYSAFIMEIDASIMQSFLNDGDQYNVKLYNGLALCVYVFFFFFSRTLQKYKHIYSEKEKNPYSYGKGERPMVGGNKVRSKRNRKLEMSKNDFPYEVNEFLCSFESSP